MILIGGLNKEKALSSSVSRQLNIKSKPPLGGSGVKKGKITVRFTHCDPQRVPNNEKASPAGAGQPVFLFTFLRLASGRRLENKKAGYFVPGFSFVAENIKISNQTISDFIDIVEFMDEMAIEMVDS